MRYVPELKRNLISTSIFDGLGYCTRIEHVVYKILHDALITFKGPKINSLYILDGSAIIGHAFVF